jgi:DNA-binding XRE family transcriptional regulator
MTATDQPEERWKKIPGYSNYSVSDLGTVRNDKWGRLLKPHRIRAMSSSVQLCNQGRVKQVRVARLVAAAFLPPPDHPSNQLAHVDGNTTNNAASNLRWVTCAEFRMKARACARQKLTLAQARELRALYARGGITQTTLATRYGVDQSTVSSLVRGRTWKEYFE